MVGGRKGGVWREEGRERGRRGRNVIGREGRELQCKSVVSYCLPSYLYLKLVNVDRVLLDLVPSNWVSDVLLGLQGIQPVYIEPIRH